MEKHPPVLPMAQLQKDEELSARYELLEELAASSFTRVFKALSKQSGSVIALKIESILKSRAKMTLAHEFHVLGKLQGRTGVPKVYHFGEWSGGFFLQLEYFTERLEGKTFSLGEMADLTLQLLRVVEGLHAARVLHQDLQPSSLMRSESGQVHLVGFGRTKSIPIRKHPQDVHPFTGNYRFASVRGHNQQELSKKDDLEALFYVIAHLYYRKLPWSRLSLEVDHKLAKIKQLKVNYRDILFAEMGMPFVRAFEYVASLETYGEPDYAQLKGYFKRRRTLLIEGKMQELSRAKKVSLNYSLLSPLLERIQQDIKPEEPCEAISFTFGVIREGAQRDNQNNNQLSLSFEATRDEDFTCEQNVEPNLCKKPRTITLKNPFFN